MMDNNEEDRKKNGSLPTPIDIIDLTKESPIKIRRSHKRRLGISMDLNQTSTDKKNQSNNNRIEDFSVFAGTRIKHKNVTKQTQDIAALDDTVCISDDDKHYVIESDNGEPLPLTCPICFGLLGSKLKPTSTCCGHIFCKQCLEACLLKSKKCPTCNRDITLKSCTRLFL